MARRGENIRKRKDGRWEGRYPVKTPDSKSGSKSVYAGTYSEAKRRLAEAKQAAQKENEERSQRKTPAKGRDILIAQAADDWLHQVLTTRKYSTYVKYRTVYHNHLQGKIGNLAVTQLKGQEADRFLFTGEETVSDNTRKTIYTVLGQLVKFSEEKYRLPATAFERPIVKKMKKEIELFNTSEQAGLLRFLGRNTDIFKLGILLCLHTGLRLGELCALKWADIDFQGKALHVNRTVQRIAADGGDGKTMLYESEPKSGCSKREIPLPDALAKKLAAYQDSAPYVFGGHKPMEPRTYQKKLKAYLKASGIPYRNFHALRHTFATNCIGSGMDAKCLSEIMGHSEVQITLNRYVHPSPETKRRHLNALGSIYGRHLGRLS